MVVIDRNMMLTPDEYMSLMKLLSSTRESEGSELSNRLDPSEDKPKRKTSAYSRKYKKVFKQISSQYKLKNGSWKKNGFKRAVKEAHKLVQKSMK